MICDIVPMEACHILLGRPWFFKKETRYHCYTNEITYTYKDRKFALHPLTLSQVEEDQVEMRKKGEKERDDTYTYKNEIKCSKCQSKTHKSNEGPNKRILVLRAKGLCVDSKGIFFPSSSSRLERQDEVRPCVEKGSHSKSTCIQHTKNKS